MALLNSITDTSSRTWVNGGHFKLVQTPSGTLYAFDVGPALDGSTNSYCNYYKSTNYGRTWVRTEIDTATTHMFVGVWYDRWSGISGDIIHIMFCDTTSDDVFYRSLDTSTDTLGTEYLVFTGVSAVATSGSCSIVKSRGGNLYVYFDLDGGTETGFYRSTNNGATWTARSSPAEAAGDQIILMPGYAADNQDIMGFFWDSDANEISRKLYDDSADSWAETSIATGMAESVAGSINYGWAAAPDLTNSKNILIAWTASDTLNADLLAWSIDESNITALGNVVTNSVDDQYLAAISINGSTWTVYYCGKEDGTSVLSGWLPVNIKRSTNGGTSWSSESEYMPAQDYRGIYSSAIGYAGDHVIGTSNTGQITSNGLVCSVSEMTVGVNGQIGTN